MNNSNILEILEEAGVDRELVDRVANSLNSETTQNPVSADKSIKELEFDLRQEIDSTDDWRMKAKKAAQIVSLTLS